MSRVRGKMRGRGEQEEEEEMKAGVELLAKTDFHSLQESRSSGANLVKILTECKPGHTLHPSVDLSRGYRHRYASLLGGRLLSH